MVQRLRAVVFPHAYVSEAHLLRLLSFFDKAAIFQPWYIEKTPPTAEEWSGLVETANPGDDFKPKKDFKALLSEYRQWVRNNYEQGLSAFSAFVRAKLDADFPTWELRSMIRNMEEPGVEDKTRDLLRWHFTLHLAEEMEEEQQKAATLLKSTYSLGSPLKGALEEGDVPNLLADLLGSEHFLSEERLRRILDAWFGLFGEKLRDKDTLITMNQLVMKYTTETYGEVAQGGEGSKPKSFTLTSPDLSRLAWQEFTEKREVFFADNAGRKSVADFFRAPGSSFLQRKDLDLVPETVSENLRWTFTYFPRLGDRGIPKRYGFIKRLSGRIVGFLEEAETDGP